MREQDRNELVDAINGYGQVVGLENSASGTIQGSLPKIHDLLGELRKSDSQFASQANETLVAIEERERINGTPVEESDPDNFDALTLSVRQNLRTLRESLSKLGE